MFGKLPKNTISRNYLNSEEAASLTAASLAAQNVSLWSQVSQSIMIASAWAVGLIANARSQGIEVFFPVY